MLIIFYKISFYGTGKAFNALLFFAIKLPLEIAKITRCKGSLNCLLHAGI